MSKKESPKVSKEDSELFRDSVSGTKPLNVTKRHTHRTPPKIRTQAATLNPSTSKNTPFVESDYVPPVGADEVLEYSITGFQPKNRKKLRQGRYNIDCKIDLHGLTVAQSGVKLERFINTCLANSSRCILLIHGRGSRSAENYPVLKSHVNDWLRHCQNIIAFVSALPKDGGSGAMYVLLKQAR